MEIYENTGEQNEQTELQEDHHINAKADLEEVPAEKELQTQDGNEDTFYSADEKAVSVVCTSLLDNRYDTDNCICCFFDKALNKRQVIVTESNNNRKTYDIRTLERKSDNYMYQWLDTDDSKASFTLGFYKRKLAKKPALKWSSGKPWLRA